MSETKTATKIKTLTFTPDEPVMIDGVTSETLTFRRMKAKDTLAGEGVESEVEAGFALYGAMAGVPSEVIGDLDLDDFERMVEEVAPLMGKHGARLLREMQGKAGEQSSGVT